MAIETDWKPFAEPWRTTALRNGTIAVAIGLGVGLSTRQFAVGFLASVLALWFTLGGHVLEGPVPQPAPSQRWGRRGGSRCHSPGLLVRRGVGALRGSARDAGNSDRPGCGALALVGGWRGLCGAGAGGPPATLRAWATELLQWSRLGAGGDG